MQKTINSNYWKFGHFDHFGDLTRATFWLGRAKKKIFTFLKRVDKNKATTEHPTLEGYKKNKSPSCILSLRLDGFTFSIFNLFLPYHVICWLTLKGARSIFVL